MHFVYRFFKRGFTVIDATWGELDISNEENRMYVQGVVWLGLYYALQLFLYRLPLEATAYFSQLQNDVQYQKELEQTLYFTQFFQLAGAIIGALAGAVLLIVHRRKNWKDFNSIRLVLNISAALTCIGVALSILLFEANLNINYYRFGMTIARFLFGLGWACGIGCAVIWVCEYLPPHLRLSGAMFIGIMGFSGAAILELGAAIVYQCPTDKIFLDILLAIGAIIALLSLVISRKLPKDSKLNYSYENLDDEKKMESKLKRLLWKFHYDKNYKRAVVFCLLIGCTVQYSAFFIKTYPQLACNNMKMDLNVKGADKKHYAKLEKACKCSIFPIHPFKLQKVQHWVDTSLFGIRGIKPLLQFYRYLGMILGSILIIFLGGLPTFSFAGRTITNARFFRQKATLLSYILAIKLLVMLGVFFVWLYYYNVLYDTLLFSIVASFTLGLFSASWVLCILIVAEQFSLIDRIWWVLLAPNAYRVSEFILMWYTGDVEIYGSNKASAILILGVIFIVIALLSSMGLNNNFEGDPLYLSSDQPLSDSNFTNKLNQIAKSHNNSESFLANTNLILWDHLQKKLREHYFYSSIYTINAKGHLSCFGSKENDIAFKIYGKSGEDVKSWTTPQQLSLALTEKEVQENLILKILQSKSSNNRGGLFWFSGRNFDIKPYRYLNYSIIDLRMVKVENLNRHKAVLNNSTWNSPDQAQKLIEYFSNVKCEWQKSTRTGESPLLKDSSEKLIQSFALFRIDAERYIPERYFLHIIKPHTDDCQLALMLKTAVPLSSQRLEELRTIITFIELEQKNIELTSMTNHLVLLKMDQEKTIARLSREEEHNRKAEMGWLKQKVQALAAWDIWPNQTKEFKHIHGVCMEVIDHLCETTAFNSYLLRWEAEGDIVSPEYEPSDFELTTTIEDIWIKIKSVSDFLRFPLNRHRTLFEQYAARNELFGNRQSICLKNVPSVPLKIIFFELLKNAAEKSNQDRPNVVVYFNFLENQKGLNVHIENSINPGVPIDHKQFDINEPDHSGRAGIRSVKRYLRYINDKYKYNWSIKTESTDTHFTLTLHIPQECILDEQIQ